ncbi:MAG: hypothetical protein L3J03_10045 [Desulfobacterales bacterium]|nr:hypothetical protein [Desulfobacterales bacterium]
MDSESPLRRSEFLLDSLFMNSRPFSMERPLVEENPFPGPTSNVRGLSKPYALTGPGRWDLVIARSRLLGQNSILQWESPIHAPRHPGPAPTRIPVHRRPAPARRGGADR